MNGRKRFSDEPILDRVRRLFPDDAILFQADQVPVHGELQEWRHGVRPCAEFAAEVSEDLLQRDPAVVSFEVTLQ